MRVKALETARPPRTADPARQLGAEPALLLVCASETRTELRVGDGGGRPALDTARGFEPCKLRREVTST